MFRCNHPTYAVVFFNTHKERQKENIDSLPAPFSRVSVDTFCKRIKVTLTSKSSS